MGQEKGAPQRQGFFEPKPLNSSGISGLSLLLEKYFRRGKARHAFITNQYRFGLSSLQRNEFDAFKTNTS